MKFALGQVVATPGALSTIERHDRTPLEYLQRHMDGDWGDTYPEDAEQNELALSKTHPQRLMSVYKLDEKDTIWIITEWDRSVTTILLPEDY